MINFIIYNISLLVYSVILVLISTGLFVFYMKIRKKNKSKFLGLGILCICLAGYVLGLIPVLGYLKLSELGFKGVYFSLFFLIVLAFVFITIGVYKFSKDNRSIKKIIFLNTSIIIAFVVIILWIVFF